MKRRLLFHVFFLHSLFLSAQTPGAVKGYLLWENKFTKDTVNNSSIFNFHSYRLFNTSSDSLIYKMKGMKKVSFFIVFNNKLPNSEICDINTGKNTVILKDKEISSIKSKSFPEIYKKTQFISYRESFTKSNNIQVSDTASIKIHTNPLSNFSGGISEILIYPRVINDKEKNKIESYLSLKYGVSLPENSVYYNSKYDTIWSHKNNARYLHHVTGIGRDDKGGLYQKQSVNAYSNDLLTIGLGKIYPNNEKNINSIDDLTYLLWSDNNGELKFIPKKEELKYSLARIWKVNAKGNNVKSKNFQLKFNLNNLINESDHKNYWLVVDKTSSNSINYVKANYYLLNNETISNDGIISNIKFDEDNSGYDLMSLVVAPKFFTTLKKYDTQCHQDYTNIELKAVGGEAPYSIYLENLNTGIVINETISSDYKQFTNLPYSQYKLTVEDVNHQQSSQIFDLTLAGCIDTRNAPFGEDTLLITDNTGTDKPLAKDYIYPNPVKSGEEFTIYIGFENAAPGKLAIYDLVGGILKETKLPAQQKIEYKDKIDIKGIYLVIIDNGYERKSIKLIVE